MGIETWTSLVVQRNLKAENRQLSATVGEAHKEHLLWREGGYIPGFDVLEVALVEAGMNEVRLSETLGIPRPKC